MNMTKDKKTTDMICSPLCMEHNAVRPCPICDKYEP